MLRCNHLEEKYQSLQLHIYESSPVVSKVRQFGMNGMFCLLKITFFLEKDWTGVAATSENVYGLVPRVKGDGPKLCEEI